MLFFLGIYIIVFLLYYYYKERSFVPIVIILILLVCFRSDTVGSDFLGYVRLISSGYYDITWAKLVAWFSKGDYFAKASYGTNEGALREFGFSYYLMFLNGMFKNPKLTLNISIIVILGLYLYVFRKICREDSYICLFIFFSSYVFFSSFNTLRQSLAVAIVFMSISFLYLHKYKRFILFAIIACSIHFSATMVILVVALAYFMKIDIKYMVGILIILLLLSFLNLKIPFIVNSLPDLAGRNFQRSFLQEGEASYNIYIHYLTTLFEAVMIYVFYWFYKNSDEQNSLFFKLWFIGIVLYLLLMSSPNVGRISEYFYVFQILAITLTLNQLKEVDEVKFMFAKQILIVYCSCWYAFYALRNWYGLQPYINL